MNTNETITPGEAVPETITPLAAVETDYSTSNGNSLLVDDEPISNPVELDNVAAKPLPAVKKQPAPEPKEPYKRKGKTYSISLTEKQSNRLDEILSARQKSKLSDNANHMLKQIINFAVNHEEGWVFGVPVFEEKVFFDGK